MIPGDAANAAGTLTGTVYISVVDIAIEINYGGSCGLADTNYAAAAAFGRDLAVVGIVLHVISAVNPTDYSSCGRPEVDAVGLGGCSVNRASVGAASHCSPISGTCNTSDFVRTADGAAVGAFVNRVAILTPSHYAADTVVVCRIVNELVAADAVQTCAGCCSGDDGA